jgi:hypothetical protein
MSWEELTAWWEMCEKKVDVNIPRVSSGLPLPNDTQGMLDPKRWQKPWE